MPVGRWAVAGTCGDHKTLQISMLSETRSTDQLHPYTTGQLIDSPGAGCDHIDWIAPRQAWKLRYPERGLADGSPVFSNLECARLLPYSGLRPILFRRRRSSRHFKMTQTLISSSSRRTNIKIRMLFSYLLPSRAHLFLVVACDPMKLGDADWTTEQVRRGSCCAEAREVKECIESNHCV